MFARPYPVVAPVIRAALRERDVEGALVLLRQLAYLEIHGQPAPPWGRALHSSTSRLNTSTFSWDTMGLWVELLAMNGSG
jgi:hypothetical protein